MTVSIPWQEPEWIYEGYDSNKFEDATGIVTNRAPKQIQENVLKIVENINTDLDPRLTILEKIRTIYKDSALYNNANTYVEWDVVNDGNGVLYISNQNNNVGHPLKDRDWWIPVNIFINDDIIDEFHTWSSAKLEEYLINHAYDASRIPIFGGSASEDLNKLQWRYDSKEKWKSVNPVLAKGEPGVELDINEDAQTINALFKIGDGVSTWNQLKYANDRQWIIDYIEGTGGSGGDKVANVVRLTGNQTIRGVKTFIDEIIGTVQKAKYADLAEYYESDGSCLHPGTLIQFGGDKEITIATNKVNGVISSTPGFVINADKEKENNWCPVALSGRIPILVIGPVQKFDYIVISDIPGRARASKISNGKIIGRALESSNNKEEKLILCATQFNLE